ncbi:MAG: hypothetical protein H0X51_00960 [Parachlamydiaceae bacterium]|nr:hypothetical protein [Parachlamydiaceae bacterium]
MSSIQAIPVVPVAVLQQPQLGALSRDLNTLCAAIKTQHPTLMQQQEVKVNDEKRAPERLQLITGLFGKLCNPSSGWGVFWRLYYRMVCCCRGQAYRERHVVAAIKRMREEYDAQWSVVKQHVANYSRLFQVEEQLRTQDQTRQFRAAEKAIRAWHHATYNFIELLNQSASVERLFQPYLVGEETFIKDQSSRSGWQDCYRMIVLASPQPQPQLGALTHNLVELCSAIRAQHPTLVKQSEVQAIDEKSAPERLQLITGLFGKLYNPASGWGLLWRVYYRLVCCGRGQTHRENNVTTAIKGMREDYNKQWTLVKRHIINYEKLVQIAEQVRTQDQTQQFQAAEKAIRGWHHATDCFFVLINKSPNVKRLFKPYLKETEAFIKDETSLSCWQDSYNVIVLKDLAKGLPVAELYQMLEAEQKGKEIVAKPLEEPAQRVVNNWLTKINGITIRDLTYTQRVWREGIRSLVKFRFEGQGTVVSRRMAIVLEYALKQLGEKLLQKTPTVLNLKPEKVEMPLYAPDPAYLRWRATLQPRSSIVYCNKERLTLGDSEQSKKSEEQDRTRVFRVQGHASAVRFGQNRLDLELRRFEMEKSARSTFGEVPNLFPRVTIHDVDREGLVSIEEYLFPFDTLEWTTKSVDGELLDWVKQAEAKEQIAKADSEKADMYLECLQLAVKHARDVRLIVKQLRLRKSGQDPLDNPKVIVSTHPTEFGSLDFDEFELLIWQIANNNPYIFRYLMVNSQVRNQMKEASVYRNAVQYALEQNPESVEPKTPRAKQLVADMSELVESIYKELPEDAKKKFDLKIVIKKYLAEAYDRSASGSLLWKKKMQIMVVERCIQKVKAATTPDKKQSKA